MDAAFARGRSKYHEGSLFDYADTIYVGKSNFPKEIYNITPVALPYYEKFNLFGCF
jgi:hypothetical protein